MLYACSRRLNTVEVQHQFCRVALPRRPRAGAMPPSQLPLLPQVPCGDLAPANDLHYEAGVTGFVNVAHPPGSLRVRRSAAAADVFGAICPRLDRYLSATSEGLPLRRRAAPLPRLLRQQLGRRRRRRTPGPGIGVKARRVRDVGAVCAAELGTAQLWRERRRS